MGSSSTDIGIVFIRPFFGFRMVLMGRDLKLLPAIRRSLEFHRNPRAARRLLFRLRDSASLNLTLHQ